MKRLAIISIMLLCIILGIIAYTQTNEVNGKTGMFPNAVDYTQYVVLNWPATNGTVYQIQYCTNSFLTNWTVYTNIAVLSDGLVQYTCYMTMGTNATFRVMR